jgi:hypothetical protein
MKLYRKTVLAGLLAAGMAAFLSNANAATFDGKVSSVSKSAQTVVVDGETYQMLPTSQITRNGRPATFSDIKVGRHLAGEYKKSENNTLEVLSAEIGKDASPGGSDTAQSFNGEVSRVNRSGQTLKIGDRTFYVLPTTTITRASGEPATLDQLKADQHVSGTYKESSEGRLELLTLEIGKKNRD